MEVYSDDSSIKLSQFTTITSTILQPCLKHCAIYDQFRSESAFPGPADVPTLSDLAHLEMMLLSYCSTSFGPYLMASEQW